MSENNKRRRKVIPNTTSTVDLQVSYQDELYQECWYSGKIVQIKGDFIDFLLNK